MLRLTVLLLRLLVSSNESVTRVISQSDALANVDQMETSGAHERLSVGVDCLSINAVGATANSIDPPVRASARDIMSVCPSVNAVGATASIVDLSDKVCLQDISSVCLCDQTSDTCYVVPRHVASETFHGVTCHLSHPSENSQTLSKVSCHLPNPSENSQISRRVVRHLPYLFENSHISMHRDDDVRSNEKSAVRRLRQVSIHWPRGVWNIEYAELFMLGSLALGETYKCHRLGHQWFRLWRVQLTAAITWPFADL